MFALLQHLISSQDKDLKLQANESCLVFLGAMLNQISESNVNFKQHFIKKEKIISNKDSMSFWLI